MRNPTFLFDIQQAGQKSRLARVEKTDIRIGFRPGCDIQLEPQSETGAELLMKCGPNEPCIAHPTTQPNPFLINGAACKPITVIARGDIISSGTFQVTIRDFPGSTATPAEPAKSNGTGKPNSGNDPAPGADQTLSGVTVTANPTPNPKSFADRQAVPDPVALNLEEAQTIVNVPEAKPEEPPTPPVRRNDGLKYLYLFFKPVVAHLMDDEVSEIMINGPRQIFIERKGKVEFIQDRFPSEQALQAAVMNVARSIGRYFDKDNPRLDARLPDGSRVHAVMPPLARSGTTVAIRKFRKDKLTIEQLVEKNSISVEGAQLLDGIVKIGKNLLVSGATSSGKTSVLNVLSSLIPEHDRILVLEDASELQLQQKHTVCFETRKADEYGKGEVTIRDLLHSALRLRPDRIVVGEIRSGEALDLLQAMNTGHEGSMSTIHANNGRDSLLRLETCALLSGVAIPLAVLRQQVAAAIHVVIQTARLRDGSRKITTISEVLGLRDGDYELKDIMVFKRDAMSPDGRLEGRHVFTGYRPTFLEDAHHHGLDLSALFPA